MLVHADHLRAGHQLQPRMTVEKRLHRGWQTDKRDVETKLSCRLGCPAHDLGRRVVAAHGVDRYSHVAVLRCRGCGRLACAWMNFLRGSTSGPISFSKMS